LKVSIIFFDINLKKRDLGKILRERNKEKKEEKKKMEKIRKNNKRKK